MRRTIGLFLAAAALCLSLPAQQVSADYQQLVHPQLTRQTVVEGAVISWGALRFTLIEGKLALAVPVKGRQMLAVFSGHGVLTIVPPNPIEAQQMQLAHGLSEGRLTVNFTQAIFRYSDGAAWLKALGPDVSFQTQTPDPTMAAIVDNRSQAIADFGYHFAVRGLLALDSPPSRWLLADLDTAHDGWLQAQFEPLDSEEIEVHRTFESKNFDDAVVDDVWTHFANQPDPSPQPWTLTPKPPPVTYDGYNIDLAIPGNLDIQETTSFNVHAAVPTTGLLLELDSELRIQTATISLDGGPPQNLQYLQSKDPGNMEQPRYVGDWVYLRLPQPLAAGAAARLTLQYHGKRIVKRVGRGNYFVAGDTWYPTNPWGPPLQRSNFQMRFQVDKNDTVVATGTRLDSRQDNGKEISNWKTRKPIAMAGFAFGEYEPIKGNVKLPDGRKVALEMMVNKHPDDAIDEINLAVTNSNPLYTPPAGILDPRAQAPQALGQVAAALKFMNAYFGPYPYSSLSVTDIPGDYGQGWPGLLYLSSLSFLDSTQLHLLGLPSTALAELTDTFRAHEVSHQWWGNLVSWSTYHDQWLSEGFANGSALLFQQTTDGQGPALDTLKQWKRELEYKNRLGHVADSVGPLWLGTRLSSGQAPDAYQTLTYDKGGYVFWMLREMMLDSRQKNPDIHFINMMKDFTSTYAGRDASTADFQKILEKHMRPAMDVDGNHSMDWFFREYVFGTGIDKLGFKAQITPQGKGARVIFTVSNPQGWVGLLPLYIWQGKKYLRAQLAIHGRSSTTTVNLGFRPDKIVANQYDDMLIDVSQ